MQVAPSPIERMTTWVGSISSLVVHTVFFATCVGIGLFHVLPWDTVLLVLTTAVSLEAIYLAIFIQMTVNRQTESLRNVEEDVDEIQKDVDEIQEDVDEIQKDVDEIQVDVDEIQVDVDEIQKDVDEATLEGITAQIKVLLKDVERMKKP